MLSPRLVGWRAKAKKQSWEKFIGPETCGSLLGAFGKLRKANISFVMSVCLHAWNKSAPTAGIFVKIHISGLFFSEICLEDTSFVKIAKNNGYFT
jgi:hypothetical protein